MCVPCLPVVALGPPRARLPRSAPGYHSAPLQGGGTDSSALTIPHPTLAFSPQVKTCLTATPEGLRARAKVFRRTPPVSNRIGSNSALSHRLCR